MSWLLAQKLVTTDSRAWNSAVLSFLQQEIPTKAGLPENCQARARGLLTSYLPLMSELLCQPQWNTVVIPKWINHCGRRWDGSKTRLDGEKYFLRALKIFREIFLRRPPQSGNGRMDKKCSHLVLEFHCWQKALWIVQSCGMSSGSHLPAPLAVNPMKIHI